LAERINPARIRGEAPNGKTVMAGLDPAIHAFLPVKRGRPMRGALNRPKQTNATLFKILNSG
jgi:hypothetical protein